MHKDFEDYFSAVKQRRTEDDYKYTDEELEQHIEYFKNYNKTNLSIYKSLEFLWFQTDEGKENFKSLLKKYE